MGGIRANHRGESPWLRGLFACGEAACWDLHGFNRLGGNSVAETVVAGMLVGEYVADYVEQEGGRLSMSPGLARECLAQQEGRISDILARPGREDAQAIRRSMEDIMTRQVGLFRDEAGLSEAVDSLQKLLQRSEQVGTRYKGRDASPELVLAMRLPRMLKLALVTAQGALARQESRGAHAREDFPQRNDRDWLCRTLVSWKEGGAPAYEYEPIAIDQMELPPGFRGYGTRNILENPATAARQGEVDSIRTERAGQSRAAVQEQLLPFRVSLPARYREDNARLPEVQP